jgi:hypothetical protein
MQYFIPSGLSAAQRGQRMEGPSGTAMPAAGASMDWSPDDAPARHKWLLCQYSSAGPVSSEKHEPALEAGGEG